MTARFENHAAKSGSARLGRTTEIPVALSPRRPISCQYCRIVREEPGTRASRPFRHQSLFVLLSFLHGRAKRSWSVDHDNVHYTVKNSPNSTGKRN